MSDLGRAILYRWLAIASVVFGASKLGIEWGLVLIGMTALGAVSEHVAAWMKEQHRQLTAEPGVRHQGADEEWAAFLRAYRTQPLAIEAAKVRGEEFNTLVRELREWSAT